MSSRDKPWEHHLSSCNKGKGVPRAIKVLMFSPMRVLSERWFDTCRKSSHWRELYLNGVSTRQVLSSSSIFLFPHAGSTGAFLSLASSLLCLAVTCHEFLRTICQTERLRGTRNRKGNTSVIHISTASSFSILLLCWLE